MKLTKTLNDVEIELNEMDLKSIVKYNSSTIIKLLKEKMLFDFKYNLKHYLKNNYFEDYEYFEIIKENIDGIDTFTIFGVNTKPHELKTKIDLKLYPSSRKLNKIYETFEQLEDLNT